MIDKRLSKFVYFFMLVLIVSIPFLTADALALMITDVTVKGKTDGVPDYMQRRDDSLVVEVLVDSDNDVEPEQLSLNTRAMLFDSCEISVEGWLCKLEMESVLNHDTNLEILLHEYDESGNYHSSPVHTAQEWIRTDTTSPVFSYFEITPLGGYLEFSFKINDEDSGVKRFEIIKDSANGEIIYSRDMEPNLDGSYDKVFDELISNPLRVPLNYPDGNYLFYVRAYDALGNSFTTSPRNLEVRKTPPVLGGWYVDECVISHTHSDNFTNINVAGNDRDVCFYLVMEESPRTSWTINGTFSNLHYSDTLETEIELDGSDAVRLTDEDDSVYYFKFDDDLRLGQQESGSHTYNVLFEVSDHFGNVETIEDTGSYNVVADVPDIISFSSDAYEYDGVIYIAKNFANVKLTFQNTGIGINVSSTTINASNIGGGSSIDCADDLVCVCTNSFCEWNLTTNEEFNGGDIWLGSFEDELGNELSLSSVSEEKKKFSVVVNDKNPVLVSFNITNLGGDYWNSTCEISNEDYVLNSNCYNCSKENENADCNYNFWNDDSAYFIKGNSVDIRFAFKNAINPSVELDMSSFLAVNAENPVFDCDYDEGEEIFLCSAEAVGPLNFSLSDLDFINLTLSDIGGIKNEITIPFRVYNYAENSIWNRFFKLEEQFPPAVSRTFLTFGSQRQNNIFKISSYSNHELIDIEPECRIFNSSGYLISGFISGIDGEHSFGDDGNDYYMRMFFNQVETELDYVVANCTFESLALHGNTIYSSVDNLTFNINLHDSQSPNDAVEKEIERIQDRYGTDFWKLIGNFNKILRLLEKVCNLFSTVTMITGTIFMGVDVARMVPFGYGEPTAQAIRSAGEGSMSIVYSLGEFLGNICDIIMCNGCPISFDGDEGVQFNYGVNEPNCGALQKVVGAATNLGGFLADQIDYTIDLGGSLEIDVGREIRGLTGSGMNTKDSLILSIVGMCPKDILLNLEKQRQIECSYVKCLTENVIDGSMTINDCKLIRAQAMCDRIAGEFWALNPLSGIVDAIETILLDMLLNPANFAALALRGLCIAPCRAPTPGTPCGVCVSTLQFFEVYAKIAGWIEWIQNDGFDRWQDSWSDMNACEGLDGFEDEWG